MKKAKEGGLAFTPSFLPSDHSGSLLRLDLTTEELASHGWFIVPWLGGGGWSARQGNSSGGCQYAPPFPTVEEVSHYVLWLYIRKVPLALHPPLGGTDGYNL